MEGGKDVSCRARAGTLACLLLPAGLIGVHRAVVSLSEGVATAGLSAAARDLAKQKVTQPRMRKSGGDLQRGRLM